MNSYQADETFTDRRLGTANFELTGAHYRWIEEGDIVTTRRRNLQLWLNASMVAGSMAFLPVS